MQVFDPPDLQSAHQPVNHRARGRRWPRALGGMVAGLGLLGWLVQSNARADLVPPRPEPPLPTAPDAAAADPADAPASTAGLPPGQPTTPGTLDPSSGAPAGSWPTRDWTEASPDSMGIDIATFQKGVDYAFSTSGNEEDRKGIRTDGLVVIYDGKLIFEKYARGYTPTMRHMAWSMTKSVTSALVGIASLEGKLQISEPAHRYYPALDREGHRDITLDHLMHMSSGLQWNEGYEGSPVDSTVIAMLYTTGRQDMAAYVAAMPMAHPPDTYWMYSSGTTNLLSAILRKAVGEDAYPTYPWDKLFTPLGMRSAVLERDQAGNFVGSSYLHATPRDMAKFGYLYLMDGVWEGVRILPEGWTQYSTEMAPALSKMPAEKIGPEDRYGAMWWLNKPLQTSVGIAPKPWPDVPEDVYSAQGHWGQHIIVLPSSKLVVVRTGDDRDGSFNANEMLKHMLASLPKSQ